MNSKRLYMLLSTGLILLVSVALFGVYYGHQTLAQKSQSLTELKAKASVLESQERSLVLAKKDIQQYEELMGVAKSIVPQEKDQARTVRELVAIAESQNISISSISFPSSSLGEDVVKNKTEGVTQVEPVDGVQGLYMLNVDVSAATDVTFQNLISFLERLEGNRRTSTISSITITPGGDGNANLLNFGITLKVFVKP